MGKKTHDLIPILSKITRPIAAIKSLRSVLLIISLGNSFPGKVSLNDVSDPWDSEHRRGILSVICQKQMQPFQQILAVIWLKVKGQRNPFVALNPHNLKLPLL